MDVAAYTTRLTPILRQVRSMLMPYYGNVADWWNKEASPADVVTDLDIRVETFLADALHDAYPSIGFVGEETGGDRSAERFWLVDPIDGTAHFIRGLPFCTTMIALIEAGEVVVAAIYDFLNDQVYRAEKGRGAWCDNRPIQVSQRRLTEAYLCWESHLANEADQRLFRELRQRCILFKTVSAGFELAMIASGKLEGRVCFDPYGNDYDFAPGALLVAAAGGRVANLGVKAYDYRNVNFIAANPGVFEALTQGPEALFPIPPSA